MGWLIFFGFVLFIFLIFKAVEWENNKYKKRIESMQNKLSGIDNFIISKKIDGFGGFYIFAVDEINEKIAFVSETANNTASFSDIIGVELVEDGNTVSKKSTSRTIGGAIVGGVLLGGTGTIVGGLSGNSKQKNMVSFLAVKILLRSIDNPTLRITCFDSRTMTTEHKASIETSGKRESYIYQMCKKNADDIKDIVSVIIDRTDSKNLTVPMKNNSKLSNSVADELLKLNELKEKGILTDGEFIIQKNKILNQ